MFAGIVEVQTPVLSYQLKNEVAVLVLKKPVEFDDVRVGDSISVNGVCLTISSYTNSDLTFILGPETLKITNWNSSLVGAQMNLERSLHFGDRVHGHIVTGHVDALAKVVKSQALGESWLLSVKLPKDLLLFVWKKGSIAINGVSLTINSITENVVEVCLIPETLKRTNLGSLNVGDLVCIETDNMARGLVHLREVGYELNS